MKDEIKKRIAILSVLLIAGLILAGVGNVLGAGELVQETISKLAVKEKIVLEGNQATIYENGNVVDTFLLKEMQEGEEYPTSPTDEVMRNRSYMRNMTKEKWLEMNAVVQETMNETMNEIFEIAKRDKRVQDLIEGKEYRIDGYSRQGGKTIGEDNKTYLLDLVTLNIEVEGQLYEIAIDMNYGEVWSVKPIDSKGERSSPGVEVSNKGNYTPEMTPEEKEEMEKTIEAMKKASQPFFEIAKKDIRVQELIEGKNYSTHGMGRYTNPTGDELIDIVTLDIRVEGKEYKISIDMTNETVSSIDKKDVLDKKAFEIARKDIRVQELIEGKECYFPYEYGNNDGPLGELIEEKECLILDAERRNSSEVVLLINVGEGEMSMGDRMHAIHIDMTNETVTFVR